jgi:hypothetical protein
MSFVSVSWANLCDYVAGAGEARAANCESNADVLVVEHGSAKMSRGLEVRGD